MSFPAIYNPEGYLDSYASLLQALYSVNDRLKRDGILAPSDASLANTARLYNAIGRPLDRIPTIHIGGTNGKGSTCFKVAKALQSQGLKTGLFVSPHLASYRERIQINSQLIPERSLLELAPRLMSLCIETNTAATLFELTFILACLHYEAEGCQAVVLEVGLGGELDATNVITPCLSIICSVSLDHTRILGSTVEEIARKKAGIFKAGADALVGPSTPLGTLQEVARSRGVHLQLMEEVVAQAHICFSDNDCGLDGNTDLINSTLSLAALVILRQRGGVFSCLDIDSAAARDALLLRPPCRWEKHQLVVTSPCGVARPVEVVLDVGHNPAAIDALVKRIRKEYSTRPLSTSFLFLTHLRCGACSRVIYAMSRDKDVRSCLQSVLSVVRHDCIYFAESSSFRALSRSALSTLFKEITGQDIILGEPKSVRALVADVLQAAALDGPDSVVIICGTGYVMPDARLEIGIIEPRDDEDLARARQA